MTEQTKDEVIVKKDELSEQDLDKASGGGPHTNADAPRSINPDIVKEQLRRR